VRQRLAKAARAYATVSRQLGVPPTQAEAAVRTELHR